MDNIYQTHVLIRTAIFLQPLNFNLILKSRLINLLLASNKHAITKPHNHIHTINNTNYSQTIPISNTQSKPLDALQPKPFAETIANVQKNLSKLNNVVVFETIIWIK